MVGCRIKTVEAYGVLWHHCPGCQRYLKRDDFAKNKNREHGLHAYCLECNRRKQAAERARRGEDYREMRRRYRKTESGRKAYNRYRKVHPGKVYAHKVTQEAIRNSELMRPDKCEQCGKGGIIDSHHDDYAKVLEVRWLCRWCHQEWHRINGEAPNADAHHPDSGRLERFLAAKRERLPLVLEMYEAGKSQKEIAEHFGVTQATIHHDLKGLGLTRQYKSSPR
jgi:ribosomal protein S27AE